MKCFYKILLFIFTALELPRMVFGADCHENEICNPLGVNTFIELLEKILKWIVIVSAPVAAIMIIVGGIKYMSSGGKQDKLEEAKKTITWALVGYAIILLSWSIVLVIQDFLGVK